MYRCKINSAGHSNQATSERYFNLIFRKEHDMRQKTNVLRIFVFIGLALLMLPLTGRAVTIEPNIQVDHPLILADSSMPVYITLRFDIPKRVKDFSRPDLNLALVIDRSGSMSDRGKMEYAIEAACRLVDQLQPTDRLSVVEYDDVISVLIPSTKVESKERIKSRIRSLYPRNSTNLCAGMMRGVDEIIPYLKRNQINRVLLLSDGLANTGITNPSEIRRMVRGAKAEGVTITTMGLGLDYNEDMMRMIAENAGGNYYFIESPNQMAHVFNNELGTLFATVGKDVRLRFSASPRVREIKVFGYVSENDRNISEIEMENFYTGEERLLVMRLDLDPMSAGEYDLGEITFDYRDIDSDKMKTFSAPIKVKAVTDENKMKQAENYEAVVEALLVEADNMHDEQIKLFKQGDKAAALDNISLYTETLSIANGRLQNKMIEKKIEALNMEAEEMDWAEEEADNMKFYNLQNSVRFHQAQKGKRDYYMMQEGDNGLQVQKLKQALQDEGFYKGTVDENFDDDLAKAVSEFQKREGLTVDGIAGPATLKKLGLY